MKALESPLPSRRRRDTRRNKLHGCAPATSFPEESSSGNREADAGSGKLTNGPENLGRRGDYGSAGEMRSSEPEGCVTAALTPGAGVVPGRNGRRSRHITPSMARRRDAAVA